MLLVLVAVGVIFLVMVTRLSTLTTVLSRGLQERFPGDSSVYPPTVVTTNKPNVVDMYNRLVTVSAISDNHFVEAQEMLASVQRCLPHNKLIVYDLGLNENNRNKFKTEYIEIRIFRSAATAIFHM